MISSNVGGGIGGCAERKGAIDGFRPDDLPPETRSLFIRMLEQQNKDLVCEVCGESIDNRTTVGLESDRDITWPIRLCHRCGPIDLDLMQLCREVTIGCTDNKTPIVMNYLNRPAIGFEPRTAAVISKVDRRNRSALPLRRSGCRSKRSTVCWQPISHR